MNKKILIVEDDRGLNQGIALALKNPDFDFITVFNLEEGLKQWHKQHIDLVLLDINLPDGSGYELLKAIRQSSQVPVIMLTANDMEIDEVTGLRLGADDYITKPFSLMVLRARVERMMERMAAKGKSVYQDKYYYFDFEKMEFSVDGKLEELSKTEQKLLRLLTDNPGRILTREMLSEGIWNDGMDYVDENALSVGVNRLRKKLEVPGEKGAIQTVYGIGYQWEKKL